MAVHCSEGSDKSEHKQNCETLAGAHGLYMQNRPVNIELRE